MTNSGSLAESLAAAVYAESGLQAVPRIPAHLIFIAGFSLTLATILLAELIRRKIRKR
jgi:hypothetical protein